MSGKQGEYIRPKRFRLRDLDVGDIIELSYGPLPQDKSGPWEVTELRPIGSSRGHGDRLNLRKLGSDSSGVGFPLYRVHRIIRKMSKQS